MLCRGSRQNLANRERLALSTFAPGWLHLKPGSAATVLSVSNGWMTEGNCLASDLDFHADHQESLRKAAAVCTSCPVIDKCLRYALAHMDDGDENDPGDRGIGRYGVWGGTLPIDRWALLKRRPSLTERRRAA